MAEVVLPRSLVALFPGLTRHVSVEGGAVRDVIAALDIRAPGMADRVLTAGPAIREHINVFVDGELADLDATVGPTSTVHIIPAVSGGEAGLPARARATLMDVVGMVRRSRRRGRAGIAPRRA